MLKGDHVQIVDYQPSHAAAFKALNEEWIGAHFQMEAADHQALDHPQEYILDRGGRIFVALLGAEAVGVCALISTRDGFELAKMAVSPKARGRGVGWLLGKAALAAAAAAGAKRVFLESNTLLKPAISLYEKLGFRRVPLGASPYARVDIRMEVDLVGAKAD